MPQTDHENEIDRSQSAFLVRCWREAQVWRYSVEDVAARCRRRYDSVEELLASLREQMPDTNPGALEK